MTLTDFLRLNQMTDGQFAALVARDRSTVSRWRNGTVRPNWRAIDAIRKATRGKVTAADFDHYQEAAE